MIAYLEGLLAETWGTSCIVVTRGGVGYELDLPAHTMASLPGRGESVALYTSLVVREDAQQLFGFATFSHTNLTHCYLATDVERMDVQHLDQAEDIEVRLFSRDEVMEMLEKGEIWQSLMAAPLWKYFAKAK